MSDATYTVTVGDQTFEGHPSLTNVDLVPVPTQNRTWTWWNFGALWMGMVHNIYNFTWMGGLVAIGYSIPQALLVAVVGNLIQTALIGLNGRVGARHGIPFSVWARTAFGVYGANIPALIRGLVAIGWFGVQSFLGATAVNLLLATTIGPWKALGATVIGGVGMNLWIAMIIYWALNLLVIRHGMETVRRFESWAGPMIFVVMILLVIWAISSAGGLGPIFQTPSKFNSTATFLLSGLVPGVALYISGSWATMCLNIPDLTRFARSNREQFWGTMIGLPFATLVYYIMVGIIVSAGLVIFHKAFWNPSDLLMAINNPGLSIVGAILLSIATISVNIPANIVSPSYDLTNLLPRYINFKTGGVIAIVLSFIYMPWKLMANPAVLYGILNNIGAFLGPATGIIMADYFFIRKQRIDVQALYDPQGRYRASGGFNIPVLVTMGVITGILVMGEFVPAVSWLFTYSWFLGFFAGFIGDFIAVAIARSGNKDLPAFAPVGETGREALEELTATGMAD